MSIIQNLPQSTLAYQRKYGNPETLSYLAQLQPSVTNALMQFDQERVMRGGRPLSDRETLLATQAAQQGRAITPERERGGIGGFFTDILDDASDITGSILHIPQGLYQEAKSLPSLATKLPEALSSSSNPLDIISNVAALPGIRFLPGAFIAENLNKPGQLLEHPLFTAMDLIPGLGKAAKATKVGRAATAAGEIGATRALLTRTLGEAGELTPNRLGGVTADIAKQLGPTKAGQLVKTMWGKEAKAISRLQAEYTYEVQRYLDPKAVLPPDSPIMARMMRKNMNMSSEFEKAGLPRARQTQIQQEMKLTPEKMASYSDLENGYVGRFIEMNDVSRRYGLNEKAVAEAVIGDSAEIYDINTVNKITKAQKTNARNQGYAGARANNSTVGTDAFDPTTVVKDLTRARDLPLPLTDRKAVMLGNLDALHANGNLDRGGYLAAKQKIRRATADDLSHLDLGDELGRINTSRGAAVTDLKRISEEVSRIPGYNTGRAKSARTLATALNNGDWNTALKTVRGMEKAKLYGELDFDRIKTNIRAVKQQQRFMNETSTFTNKLAKKSAEKELKVTGNAVPARFQEKIDEVFEQKVKDHVKEIYSTDPKLDEYLKLAEERNYPLIQGLDQKTLRRLQREANASWLELKEAGFNPIFVHRVRPQTAKQMSFTKITDRPRTPSQVKERMGDLSSFSDDASIILTHQALEWLVKKGSDEFVDEMGTTFGKTRRDVIEQYQDIARRRAGDDPRAVAEKLTEMISKEWVKFPPDSLKGYGRVRASALASGDEILVPRHVGRVMEQLYDAPLEKVTALTDPIMNAFRTSLLPLSPRWHMYNILGGGVALQARTSPFVWKHLREAYKMVKNREAPEGLMLGGGAGQVGKDVAEYAAKGTTLDRILNKLKPKDRAAAEFSLASGKQIRGLWDVAQKLREAGGKFVQGSYTLNGFFDDMYRAMAYLEGRDKGLTRGMTKEAAHASGVALTRKIMQNWDEMTPLERTIMRNVFPFYGWMSHIMKYVMTYPIDHPIRASVTSNFARNELEDWGTGLPQQFAQLFYWGDMDKNGSIKAINLGGANPFADVQNYFTWQGFTGNVSPLIGVGLRLSGVDPSTGSGELYPTLRFDPETGRMVAEKPNALATIAESIIPQSRIITNATGMSNELRDLIAHNPDSARRYLQSTMGLPVITKDVNLHEERFKGELRRDREQRDVLNDALRTGDFSAAQEYPGLRSVLDQIEVLKGTGALEQFQPPTDEPSYQALLGQAATLGMLG